MTVLIPAGNAVDFSVDDETFSTPAGNAVDFHLAEPETVYSQTATGFRLAEVKVWDGTQWSPCEVLTMIGGVWVNL